MKPITFEELEAIEAYCAKATPGPWEYSGHGDMHDIRILRDRFPVNLVSYPPRSVMQSHLTAEEREQIAVDYSLMADARTDLPRLCAELRRRIVAEQESGNEA